MPGRKKITRPPTVEKRTGLARVLSKMGYCSRTEATRLIREGRVELNGKVQQDAETPVRVGTDRISIDGVALKAQRKEYWMINKPRGLVTTAEDERGRETVYSLLPEGVPWMGPVGRLDMASEGLLLLTNDTEWAARITSPKSHVDKTYHVQLDRVVDAKTLESFQKGVRDSGELLKARHAHLLRAGDKNSWVEVVLDEGKNRQIRRMAEALGFQVLRLVRVAIGRVMLGDLPKGQARRLTAAELKALTL